MAESTSVVSGAAPVASPQHGSDLVGFGKHGEMTYDEMWAKEPRYCQWTISKFRELITEGVELDTPFQEGDSKMKRLAQWLIEKDKQAESNGPRYEHDKNGELVEVPSSLSLKERADAALSEKAPKFYAIAAPEKRVCTSWEECKPYVHGVKGVMYRSFPTREEAEEYVQNPPARKVRTAPPKKKKEDEPKESAQVDGSGGGDSENASAPKKKGARQKKAQAEDGTESLPPKKKRKVATPSTATDGAGAADAAASTDAKPEAEDSQKTKGKPKAKAKAKVTAKAKPKGKILVAKCANLVAKAKMLMTELKLKKAAGKSKAKAKAKGAAGTSSKDVKETTDAPTDQLTQPTAGEEKPTTQASSDGKGKAAKEKHATEASSDVKSKASKAAKEKPTTQASSDGKGKAAKEKRAPEASDEVKGKASKAAKATPGKSKKETSAQVIDISDEVMKQAESLGFAASLRNLASRPEIVSASLSGDKLLQALQACDGLVNKAKVIALESEVSTPSKEASQGETAKEGATPIKEHRSQPDAPPSKIEADKVGSVVDEHRQRIQEQSGGA